MKENFIIPQNWDKPEREIVEPISIADFNEKFAYLNQTAQERFMINTIQSTLIQDGLDNHMPFGSEPLIAEILYKFTIISAGTVMEKAMEGNNHIVIRSNGELGLCNKSRINDELVCYQRSNMNNQLLVAKSVTKGVTGVEKQLTDQVLKDIIQNPFSVTSRILFSIVYWSLKNSMTYTNNRLKFTVDGSWMRIDITNGEWGMDVVDLVLLRNLPEEQYDILKAYSLNFFNDNKDKTL